MLEGPVNPVNTSFRPRVFAAVVGNGKRCRLTGSQSHFGLCPHHFSLTKPTASLELYNDAEDLTADLLPQLSELLPSIDLRQFLARLLTLVTRGRISPRRASVLAYIGNPLLNSRPRSHP